MKREWGVTDPFQFPPNEFHYGLLRTVEPFLRIHKGPRDLECNIKPNKFEGGQMKRDALEACVHLTGLELAAFERSFKDARGELGWHLEMMRQVEKFTTPPDLDRSFMPALTGEEDDHEQRGFFISGPSCVVPAPQADDEVVPAAGHLIHSPSRSGDDQSGYDMDTEAPPQDVAGTDCRGFVFDERPRRRASEGERDSLDSQRCVFVAEFKSDEDNDAIPQAAASARLEVRRNLANRHYEPMHLIALSRTKFTYAVLKVQGYILAGGQYVTGQAYKDFVETAEPGSKPDSHEVLKELFKTRTTLLRENFRSQSRPSYPKRPYIVGDLYVAPGWYMLPSNEVYHGMVSPEATAFYEGLLRIVVGDRILDATVANVVDSVAVRMVQGLKQTDKGGLALSTIALLRRLVDQRALQWIEEVEEPDRPPKRPRGNHELPEQQDPSDNSVLFHQQDN